MAENLQTGNENGAPTSKVNPWAIILLTFPIPVFMFGVLFYKWSAARTDFKRITSQLIQRQNIVLAYDAMGVAQEVSHLLENAARDVQALSLIPPTLANFTKFYVSRVSQLTQMDTRDDSVSAVPLPMYTEMIYLNLQGEEQLRLRNGKSEGRLRRMNHCVEADLCDPKALQKAVSMTVGEVFYGTLVRWYAKEGTPENQEGAYLPVYYKSADGIFMLGVDYRYLKELLTQPTFPYDRKRNLLQSYQNGNYIYIVDNHFNLIAHPKYWHVTGIDPKTSKRVTSMINDSEEGTRPLNVRDYQGEKLREYFDRLLHRSFLQRNVDIFQAPNLRGTNRVLSVAPILLQKGQFLQSGVFGHVILGCSVDYFEEPKEQYVPYY